MDPQGVSCPDFLRTLYPQLQQPCRNTRSSSRPADQHQQLGSQPSRPLPVPSSPESKPRVDNPPPHTSKPSESSKAPIPITWNPQQAPVKKPAPAEPSRHPVQPSQQNLSSRSLPKQPRPLQVQPHSKPIFSEPRKRPRVNFPRVESPPRPKRKQQSPDPEPRPAKLQRTS